MAYSSWGKEKPVLPNVGEAANQSLDFNYSKRELGKTKVCAQSSSGSMVCQGALATLRTAQDLAFCHTWVTAVASGKLALLTGNVKDSAFISTGFSNWNDVTVSFAHHMDSTTQKTAVELVITLPKTLVMLASYCPPHAHAAEKESNRKCLATIAQWFLARQALALCGDDEYNSNLMQIL